MTRIAPPVRIAAVVAALFSLDLAYRALLGEGLSSLTIALAAVNGVLLGLLLAWLVPKLEARRLHVVAILWLVLFIVEFASTMIEGYFYTTVFTSVGQLLAGLPVVALFALAQAALAGLILIPSPTGPGFRDVFRRHLATRPTRSWAWRITAASVLYLPIYFFFGALVGPFVLAYYETVGLGLTLPPFTTIIPLEIARGLMYVVALLPVLAMLRGGRWTPFLAMAGFLFIPGAVLPLLTRTSLPAAILPFHALELLADSLVYGFVLATLLRAKLPDEVRTTDKRSVTTPGRPS